MHEIILVQASWTSYNGYLFDVLHIENKYFDASLFRIMLSREFLYLDILFFNIKIFDKTDL